MKTSDQLCLIFLMGLFCAFSCKPAYYDEPRVVSLSVVETIPATDITSSEATFGINIVSNGNSQISEFGIVYATTQNPDYSDWKVKEVRIAGGKNIGSWPITLTGLTPGTTYHVRAYAINSLGIAYGPEESFSCCPPQTLPTVFTIAPRSGDNATQYLSGQLIACGSSIVSERGFVYATSQNPTESDTKVKVEFDFESSGTEIYSGVVSGLKVGIVYYVRAYAINSVGIAYGNQESFICI